MKIESFTVYGLHNKYNYRLLFEDNSLIIVGENGQGKTTIVNLFFYFLSRQWRKINDYAFAKLVLNVDGKELTFEKSKYQEVFLRRARLNKRYPENIIRKAESLISSINISSLPLNLDSFEILADRLELPPSLIREIIFDYREGSHRIDSESQVAKLESELSGLLSDIQIVYLPTYRRIEKDLKLILPQLEGSMRDYESKRKFQTTQNEKRGYIELVEFGMEDVKEIVERKCIDLKNLFYRKLTSQITGSYLEDILYERYKQNTSITSSQFNAEALDYLLKRLDDSVLSTAGKQKLSAFVNRITSTESPSVEDRFNAYFVSKLFSLYKEQKDAEVEINSFVSVCNSFFSSDKHLLFDNENFKVEIELLTNSSMGKTSKKLSNKINKSNETIGFQHLSSGEKQIASLFSHLVLNSDNFIIIIDEPELSLSVTWQEKFIPAIQSLKKCKGVLAVTHSPFIFKNDLISKARSLEEFSI